MENISGPVRLHTSVTTVELGELPGDLTLDSDDLHITEAKGLVRVVSHSKDIDLSQIYGDSIVEDRNGRIAVEPAGNFGVEAKEQQRRRGDHIAARRLGHGERADAQRRHCDGLRPAGERRGGQDSERTDRLGHGAHCAEHG